MNKDKIWGLVTSWRFTLGMSAITRLHLLTDGRPAHYPERAHVDGRTIVNVLTWAQHRHNTKYFGRN